MVYLSEIISNGKFISKLNILPSQEIMEVGTEGSLAISLKICCNNLMLV